MSEDTNELVRMQVLLHREEREALEDEAHRQGVSMSEVVRQAVRMLREEAAPYDAGHRAQDPFFGILGIGAALDDRYASETVDDELYGPLRAEE